MQQKKLSLKDTVCKVIDSFPSGKRFYGWQLKNRCVYFLPDKANKYEDSFLRVARKYRRDSYFVVCKPKSLYEKV